MTLKYKENGIYIAECNICRCVLGAEKNSQTEMELFLKNNGWKIWKSNNVHQPNCICYNCKSVNVVDFSAWLSEQEFSDEDIEDLKGDKHALIRLINEYNSQLEEEADE